MGFQGIYARRGGRFSREGALGSELGKASGVYESSWWSSGEVVGEFSQCLSIGVLGFALEVPFYSSAQGFISRILCSFSIRRRSDCCRISSHLPSRPGATMDFGTGSTPRQERFEQPLLFLATYSHLQTPDPSASAKTILSNDPWL